jgi:hypothetical protein
MNNNMQDILKNYYANGGRELFESREELAEGPFAKALATATLAGTLAMGSQAQDMSQQAMMDIPHEVNTLLNSPEHREWSQKSEELMGAPLWNTITKFHKLLDIDSEIEYHYIANDRYRKQFRDLNKDYIVLSLLFKTVYNTRGVIYRGDIAVDTTGTIKDINIAFSINNGGNYSDIEKDMPYKSLEGKTIPGFPKEPTLDSISK